MADSTAKPVEQSEAKFRPLRVWPAVLLIIAMLSLRFLPSLIPERSETLMMTQAMGPLICAGLIMIWWLAFSRARWFERIVGLVGIVTAAAAAVLTPFLMHDSMKDSGAKFLAIPIAVVLTIPMGIAAFGIGAALVRDTLGFRRTVIAILVAMIGFGFTVLLRNDGMNSSAEISVHWRWSPSAEEKLVEKKQNEPDTKVEVAAEAAEALSDPEWAGFRGADRTGRQRGSVISDDWSETPEQIWKIAVGPGWSSFSIAGDLLYTQEQRNEFELVVCYDANTGDEIWAFEVKTRFFESIGGAGPRGTPTLATLPTIDGVGELALFALGANGALVRLDPVTGDMIWQKELQTVADRKPPMWGFSASPLVIDSKVVVHAGGQGDKGSLAFDTGTGELVWSAKSGDHSYSSPQLCNILGEDLVLMLSNTGLEILDPSDGNIRLAYDWKCTGYRALQPQVFGGNTVVVPTGEGIGTRRIELAKSGESDALSAKELWTSTRFKPDFNDFVAFEGHLYGFDASIFACIDLESGSLDWKGGRYGKGQVLLLEDSGLLLVASEKGKVVLLRADPSEHIELGSFQAIEGKTWNHPVVVGDRLFIRNAEEAACYRLPMDGENQ